MKAKSNTSQWHGECFITFISKRDPTKTPTTLIPMNNNLKNSKRSLTLGDLVLAVSSSSRNLGETAAAIADLLESGRVRIANGTRTARARVS
jgi:hypothetical protein